MASSPAILVFTTQLMPTGGIESHLREFCLHIINSGVEIDLVVLNSAVDEETETFYRQYCRNVYLGNNGRSSYRHIWLFLTALRVCLKPYNALYTNGQGDSINFFSKLILRNNRWLHHHHTSGDIADQEKWSKRYLKVLNSANSVIACSKTNASNIETAIKRTVVSVPCFSRAVTGVISMTKKKLRFGYYGRLIPEKGIDLICQLSNEVEFKEIEFHLWGEGVAYPATFFNKFPNIKYHGKFSGREGLIDAIASIDAFLLLSTHPEGLPISLLEVMSAGTPWLATAQGGIPDIALDPLATRVISTSSDYLQIKNAVHEFALDLRGGKVSRIAQQDLYTKQFSSQSLKLKWLEMLGVNYIKANN